MTPSDAAAPLQSGPDPLLELLLLELLLLELLLLELLLPPDVVSATTTPGPSDATAASAPAPRSAYTSLDITFPHGLPATSGGMFRCSGGISDDLPYMSQ
jgi:hypothetical protein